MTDIGSSLRSSIQAPIVDLVYFVPGVTLIRMTCWDLPPLKVGSSSICGTGWPLT